MGGAGDKQFDFKAAEIYFSIEGCADNRGTSSHNKILGLRRARHGTSSQRRLFGAVTLDTRVG